LPNARSCSASSAFRFELSEQARVSIRIKAKGGKFERTLFSDELLEKGAHALPISPRDLSPGQYEFTIEAVSTRTGEAEIEVGQLAYRYVTRDNLPLGHTLVKGVNLYTGAMALSSLDLQVPGRGSPLQFMRTYSSGSEEAGP